MHGDTASSRRRSRRLMVVPTSNGKRRRPSSKIDRSGCSSLSTEDFLCISGPCSLTRAGTKIARLGPTFCFKSWVAIALLLLLPTAPGSSSLAQDIPAPTHTSNHAVIVSSSRYWFNYRHVINALSIYRLVKANGIPDGNIVLMLADEYAVNPRNPLPNQLLPAGTNGPTLFDEDVEIDYRGDDVRVESFVGALTGRRRRPHRDRSGSEVDQPPQPVLDTDQDSNILIYLTGHGGDSFFKFQDAEEVLASQLASALSFMHERGLYRNVLLLADTCQAFTLGDAVAAPNVTVVGSSLRGESSYAHHSDDVLGLSVIERYTHALMEFLRGRSLDELTLRQGLVDPYSYASQGAHIGANDNTSVLKMDQVRMSDFFANAPANGAASAANDTAIRIVSDREPVLFSHVSLSSERSLDQTREGRPSYLEELQASTCDGIESQKLNSEALVTEPRRTGVSDHRAYEPADSVFVALVTLLIGSIVWAASTLLSTNRTG